MFLLLCCFFVLTQAGVQQSKQPASGRSQNPARYSRQQQYFCKWFEYRCRQQPTARQPHRGQHRQQQQQQEKHCSRPAAECGCYACITSNSGLVRPWGNPLTNTCHSYRPCRITIYDVSGANLLWYQCKKADRHGFYVDHASFDKQLQQAVPV